MPENRLVIELSMATGLRVSDCLAIRTEQLIGASARRITVKEQKTNKTRRVYIPKGLYDRLVKSAGRVYLFEHRTDYKKHRTRQAVWKDVKRAAQALRIEENFTPHSARKIYAVDLFEKTGDIEKVSAALKHSSVTVTMIYAMANHIDRIRGKKK